ncbi:hypothetical protein ACF1CG_11140 [Streptomyces sp. NPDC014773]|uniref:hypothetical protein n=1 Tax=Streptomyces sp. NPDC014773 TaxID=3364908 RepID=UPI00370187FE
MRTLVGLAVATARARWFVLWLLLFGPVRSLAAVRCRRFPRQEATLLRARSHSVFAVGIATADQPVHGEATARTMAAGYAGRAGSLHHAADAFRGPRRAGAEAVRRLYGEPARPP